MTEYPKKHIYNFSAASNDGISGRTVCLSDLGLQAGWYGLDVRIEGESALVSATAVFSDARRPNLRIRLEQIGPQHFRKTFKISEVLSTIDMRAVGVSVKEIRRIEIKPLSSLSVFLFMAGKGIRYIVANRRRLSLALITKQVRAAIRPNANFAFRANYTRHEDDDASYAAWRRLHEDEDMCRAMSATLDEKLNGRTLEIALLTAEGMDAAYIADCVRVSSISTGLKIIAVDFDSLSTLSDPDFILPWDRQGEMARGGLERLLLPMIDDTELMAVFADSDRMRPDRTRTEPRLKPAWDKELLWCGDYIRAPLVLRWKPALAECLTAPEARQRPAYALALHAIAAERRANLLHIPEILFHETTESSDRSIDMEEKILAHHLRSLENPSLIQEKAKNILCVQWQMADDTRTSIIIPTRDSPELLKKCIDSIRLRTAGRPPEIIVADNGSVQPETKALFDALSQNGFAKIVPCPGPFNFSKINNDARRHATGDVIVLLNDDTQAISPNWLRELASLALRPGIGAVGSLLLYPDGTVQHAGIILGICGGIADHAFRHFDGNAAGYLNLLQSRREVSAVTGACLAVAAEDYDAVGGLDEMLPVTLNDVDFCLRLRARGLVNIWTPWSVVEHWESKTRGIDYTNAALDRQAREVRIFSSRWSDLVVQDPYYHIGLNDNAPDYHLAI